MNRADLDALDTRITDCNKRLRAAIADGGMVYPIANLQDERELLISQRSRLATSLGDAPELAA